MSSCSNDYGKKQHKVNENIVQFSDLVKQKLGATLIASVDVGVDELGNQIATADLGPTEVSIYTSQDDGAMVVQIDSPTLSTREHPSLRVYLNDTTLYDSITEAEAEENTHTNESEQ